MEQPTLRELREDAELSINDVARMTGVSAGALSYWENGEHFPSPEYGDAVRFLADFYGTARFDIG